MRNRALYVAEWQNEVSWSFKIESFWAGLPETLSDPSIFVYSIQLAKYLFKREACKFVCKYILPLIKIYFPTNPVYCRL